MQVVDSSAILAIAFLEDAAARLSKTLALASRNVMSVVNAFECHLVARSRFGQDSETVVDALLETYRVELLSVELCHLALARKAHTRFGKGTGHPAQLNFGDCFADALSRDLGAPLLFKGDDFAATDLTRASLA
jgi:ribonuclease VapC